MLSHSDAEYRHQTTSPSTDPITFSVWYDSAREETPGLLHLRLMPLPQSHGNRTAQFSDSVRDLCHDSEVKRGASHLLC